MAGRRCARAARHAAAVARHADADGGRRVRAQPAGQQQRLCPGQCHHMARLGQGRPAADRLHRRTDGAAPRAGALHGGCVPDGARGHLVWRRRRADGLAGRRGAGAGAAAERRHKAAGTPVQSRRRPGARPARAAGPALDAPVLFRRRPGAAGALRVGLCGRAHRGGGGERCRCRGPRHGGRDRAPMVGG